VHVFEHSLDDVLAWGRGRIGVYVELKGPGTGPPVAEVVKRRAVDDQVVIGSFEPNLVAAVRAHGRPPVWKVTAPRDTDWEPAKWVAKLRATMTGGGPVLLKTNMEAGHGGASALHATPWAPGSGLYYIVDYAGDTVRRPVPTSWTKAPRERSRQGKPT